MVLPIHIEDETVIFEKDLITNLVSEYIEQDMGRVMRSMKVVCYYKYAYFRRATNKYKKRVIPLSHKMNYCYTTSFIRQIKLEDEFSLKEGESDVGQF